MFLVRKKKLAQADLHDSCVLEVAQAMKRDQWAVKADLPGYEKPEKVGDFQPDITATKKGCLRRICEVVTPEMFEGDKQRYLEVKHYCENYDFHMYIIETDGNRREIDPTTLKKK